MLKINIIGTAIHLPEVDKIPVPKTRDAVIKALSLHDAYMKAGMDREAADLALRDAPAADTARLAAIYASDPNPADVNPTELVEAAQKARDAAYARFSGLHDATTQAVNEIRVAIDEERELWKVSAVAGAKRGLTKLTTALRMTEAARDELADTIGVLGLLAGLSHPSTIAIAQSAGGHVFDIEPGIENLRNAVVEASRELGELK